ncbi:MAG TPA: polysaccharide deacetylase family protein [Bryobacteraceae bacterium]|nr:polysaccharide deacetylase family protein [Bryobacteraceae bacterium]
MRKKELLSRGLYHSGLLEIAGHFAPASVTVLTYHRIRADESASESPFDDAVFGPAQSCFARQMQWLKKRLTILSQDELLDLLRRPAKGHFAVVTFDDAYRDNYDLAWPVLRDLSIPAIFFVCPTLIEQRRVGWWDRIAYLMKHSAHARITIRGEPVSIAKLHGWMKSLPAHETKDLMETLLRLTEAPPPSAELESSQLMSWEQIAEVSRKGIAIGSHTHTHRVLATLTEEEQHWELRESKAALERQLGRRVRTLAYPAGSHGNFMAASMRAARECGYEAAFSFHSGGNRLGAIEPFDIHRIPAAEEFSPMFAGAAILPDLFSWVK